MMMSNSLYEPLPLLYVLAFSLLAHCREQTDNQGMKGKEAQEGCPIGKGSKEEKGKETGS